jgi:hypothetical protein
MAYRPKGQIDQTNTNTIQEQLNWPAFHRFEDCRDKIRLEADAPDNPLSYEGVIVALRGSRGPLMMTSFLVYRDH